MSGNFNTDISEEGATECVDPLASLISESNGDKCSFGSDRKRGASDSNLHCRVDKSSQDTRGSGIVEKYDASGKKIYLYSASTTIDVPKASSNYQTLSSSTSDCSHRLPVEVSERSLSSEDVTPEVRTLADIKANMMKTGGESVHYVSKTLIIQQTDSSSSSINGNTDQNMENIPKSDSDKSAGKKDIEIEDKCLDKPPGVITERRKPPPEKHKLLDKPKVPCKPIMAKSMNNNMSYVQREAMSQNEQNKLHLNGYLPNKDSSRDIQTISTGIKKNGCLVTSPKRTIHQRRLRARSDPSRMGARTVHVHDEYWPSKPGHQVAAVQTDGGIDGMLSPTVTRRNAHVTPIMEAMDLSGQLQGRDSSPEKATGVNGFPEPGAPKTDDSNKKSSSRNRSQSADRVENRYRRRTRTRGKSESPDRRSGSPVKSDNGKGVSKVSRSTQTHRSIVRYSNKAGVHGLSGNSKAPTSSLPDSKVAVNSLPQINATVNGLPSCKATASTLPGRKTAVNGLPGSKAAVNGLPDSKATVNGLPGSMTAANTSSGNSVPGRTKVVVTSLPENNVPSAATVPGSYTVPVVGKAKSVESTRQY